ncbi:ABC transporter ATP-binding protein [Paenibacillus sp. LHD-117]|uniref:ABC transporter ATP-binding protein n=1 Tax=Paenibacillus sp. LHD-117 TaxID=3071412 RepID=UPI0027E1F71C|nr:ABC transporter ATP-binding protein [Paenibacillus sp. LHD-117]MDQ6419534.1 ABC transporter ATP-binding protein [Paenibacillus sp. LHD-117]
MKSKPLFKEHLLNHKLHYFFGAVLLSISCLLQLVIPQLLGHFADLVQENITAGQIMTIALWIVLVGFLSAFFRSTGRIYLFRLARLLEKHIRKRLFVKWESLSSEYFGKQRIGDLMSHAVNDINIMREVGMMGVFSTIEAVVLIGVAITAMAGTVHIGLTLLVLLPLPALTYLAYRFRGEIEHRTTLAQEAVGQLTSRVQEFCAGIRVVKAYVQERPEIEKFKEDNRNNLETNRRLNQSNSFFSAISSAVVGVSYLLSVVFGGLLVMRGSIGMGDFVAFNTYLTMLIAPIENLGKVINILQRGKAVDTRLRHILDTEPSVSDAEGVARVEEIKGMIEVDGLTFRYPGQKRAALENIRLTVPQGSSLAIVGKVGSGKTTLVNLLLRLYNPPHGAIRIDGHDIMDIPLVQLRESVGFVPQEHMLFSTTIAGNIAFHPGGYAQEDIQEAAKVAQVYDNIVEFPWKFDTSLGERGVSLSGGQRQRVSIARALIKAPSILVFDDSLSAVDAETEERILEGLKRVMKERTTIITSHRLSAIRHADQIVVMDQGRIVERGDHASLMRLGGLYASTYNKQTMKVGMEGSFGYSQ